jgi:tol-pal system protein YbgF
VDYLRQDVEALTKQQQALTAEIEKLQGRLGGSPVTSPGASANAENTGGSQAPPARAEVETLSVESPSDASATEVQNLAPDPSALYKKGLDLMGGGQYPEAQAAFADFIVRFPQSDLADNAQYWIGECFYSQKDFKEARDAFRAVSDHFPFGNKVPDAVYKQALCERQLGQGEQAEATLKKLVEEFPSSEAAEKVPKP